MCQTLSLILIARWIWSHKYNLCTLKWSEFPRSFLVHIIVSGIYFCKWPLLVKCVQKKYLQTWLEIMESRPTTCLCLNVSQSFIHQQLITFRPLEEVEHVWRGKPQLITPLWQTTGNSYIMARCMGKGPVSSVKISRTPPSQSYL